MNEYNLPFIFASPKMDYIYYVLVLLAIIVMFFYFFQSIFLLLLRHFLKNKFLIELSIKSYFSETISISCPQLGINIKIEHLTLSSKLFNSKYNSLIVLKFSDIRLEGDIVAAFKCLSKIIKRNERVTPSPEDSSFFRRKIGKLIYISKRIVFPFSNYLSSNFQISLHNTSLMQLGLPTNNSIFNDCLLHSTIQLIQIGFTTKLNGQLTFQVDGFSIKVLKSNNLIENNGKTCLAQMSFPFLFNYLIREKSIDISILDLEIIVYDILQLLNILLPSQRRQIKVDNFSKYKFLEQFIQLFHKILSKPIIRDVSFRLNSGSIKLVREFGKKELTFGVKPIELRLNKFDLTRLDASLSIENFKIQDSESIIDFSLNKCVALGKIENISDKLYLQLGLEITSSSFIINNSMINSWFQYFANLFRNVKTNQRITDQACQATDELSFHDFISKYISKFVFSIDINDISLTMKQIEENSMVTYGLKHLKTVCVHNLDVYFKETSVDLVMETFWCWNGNKNLKPSNPNSLKKYNEKHVPLFMSTLILKFGNMNSSDLRINCVMDGLQVSIEYFLNQLENVEFDFLKSGISVKSSPFKSKVSGYNVLAQINFTSVNLFTSQLMVRIDSMAVDLNGRKLTCSINGFAINSMYAPSATLACLKASELTQHRIVYFSVMRINFSQDIKEISLSLTEEIFVQWSPSFHLNVLELYEDIHHICSNIFFINSSPDKPNENYRNYDGFNMNLKLDGKISFGILLTNEGDTMRFETEYLIVTFHNNSLSSKCELLSIYFNDIHNCNIEHLVIRYLNEAKNPLDRTSFRLTEKEKNAAIEIVINKVSLYFPYKFNFAYYFNEKFLGITKWLRNFYSKEKIPKYMQNDSNASLVADFIIKIQNILIEVCDDPFEVRLNDNYELMEDEFKESQKRWNKLMEKIEETRRKIVIIPESKINELKNSFHKQNAQTYIKRSRKMYEANQMRTQLFTIKAENFQLQLISDTSYNTYDKMVRILRTIDCYSPFPDDLKFSTIWCKQIFCNIGKCVVSLRDFLQPMLTAEMIYLKGVLIGAEQEASARARRTCEIDMGPNFSKIKLERSMTTLKFYHDITSKISRLIYTHGACWEPILQQVNLSFENIFKPSYDPSPSLTWWDKMRFLFHGNLHIISDQISIVFHASLDPYNSTELIGISFLDAKIELVTGKISVSSDLDVFVKTASKYDECRIIHLPDINITFNLNWDCSGNKNDHHSVIPCAKDKLPEYTCNQVHDSYRAFRSHHLNLSASIETKERNLSQMQDEPNKFPSILLYNSTLRWLENKMFMITGFPRLTRRGKLYNNTRPRKMPFTRLFKSIRLTIYMQKLEITYWSSFNQNRGFKISSFNLTHSAEHRQTFMKITDNLIHRPKPQWELIYMNSELSDVEIDLYKAPEMNSLNDMPIPNFFLNVHKVSYNRETKLPHILSDEEEQSPIHRLIVHDLKGAWTKENRDIVLSLFDSYFKTQLLKRNLSTEALRLFKDQINGSPAKNNAQQPSFEKNAFGQTQSKGNAANMLQKLISEVEADSDNVVDTEQTENVVNDRPLLHGIEACQTNDVLLNNWLIELINSQVVLRGCETDGYVIVSAAKSQVTQRIHRPVWKNRILFSKTTWQGSLECMQYYATVDAGGLRIDDITWLDLDDIEERNVREIVEIPDLVGSGRSVGGVVNSEAGGSSNEASKVPIQLQRIVSRCRCQFFYASYGENTDPNNYEEVPPLPHDYLLPPGPWEKEVAVDTFTLTHEHLEISTNSQQYAMIMDLVNNLLLYVEPHKKEVFEKQQRIRFDMQLNSIEDQREPISQLQDKVRSLLDNIKKLEKESYRLYKNTHLTMGYQNEIDRSEFEAIENKLEKCKDELNVVSEDLSIKINCYKEAQLIAFKTKERQVAQESKDFSAQVIRRNEVCFKQASWRLTDSDGQLGLADLVLNNFLYTKVSNNDDSVQHSFELGYIRVQNMLPNPTYRDVLQPTELQPNMPVDQHRALRILCIEKAPVGGISVKEHLEVNVIPLTVGLTYAFFKKMLKFFFPERSVDTANLADNASNIDIADDVSTHSSKANKKKTVIKKDESTVSLASLTSYNFKSKSKNPTSFQHIEKMRERASKNQTFVYIKMPELPIRLSYKGNKNKNLEDLHDVNLVLPPVEYHNRTWTWLDLLMALKNDSKRVLLSQALKHKFHISKSKPISSETEKKQSNQSVTKSTAEDEDKVRILLGNIVVPQKTTKSKSILLFGNKK